MDLPILSGSFASLSLFLLTLSISPSNSDYKYTLTHKHTIPGHGPHQYLHHHAPSSTIYATSWALPPALHVFSPSLSHINSTPITAVSSYITSHDSCLYSVGGPTGEVHSLSPLSQVQPILYVPLSALPTTDKTRVALRTGSHAIEIHASTRKAYVPVLGTDSIYVYSLLDNDHLQEESVFKAPEGSAPRHLKIHPNGQILYVVTEHHNTLLTYTLPSFKIVSSHSLYPSSSHGEHYRGDTLGLSPSLSTLYTTTRGGSSSIRGWLAAFTLNEDGTIANEPLYMETPTSGGKANAIEPHSHPYKPDTTLLVLTDDDESTRNLEQPNPSIYIVTHTPPNTGFAIVASYTDPDMAGGSHAIWLPVYMTATGNRHEEL